MSSVDQFIDNLRPAVATLARNTVGDFVAEAQRDAGALLRQSRDEIARWNALLAEGKLKPDEYRLLLEMQVATAGMHALTATGLLQQSVERFRQGLISLVIDSAMALVPIK